MVRRSDINPDSLGGSKELSTGRLEVLEYV